MTRTRSVAAAAAFLLAAASAVSAFAQAAPAMEVLVGRERIPDQGTVTYPNTPVGEWRSADNVTIRNTGDADLLFAGERPIVIVTRPYGSYSIERLPLGPVPAGSSVTFLLRYRPLNEGPNGGVVTISTNDPKTPLFTLRLQSYGVPRRLRMFSLDGG
ncbi:MAG TPA: hypothetical protein VHE79_13030 [Spirochaetia bacterium]